MMSNSEFLYQIKRKRASLQRKLRIVQETDMNLSQSITRKIELINIVIAEFGDFKHPKSLANLLHRNKF